MSEYQHHTKRHAQNDIIIHFQFGITIQFKYSRNYNIVYRNIKHYCYDFDLKCNSHSKQIMEHV